MNYFGEGNPPLEAVILEDFLFTPGDKSPLHNVGEAAGGSWYRPWAAGLLYNLPAASHRGRYGTSDAVGSITAFRVGISMIIYLITFTTSIMCLVYLIITLLLSQNLTPRIS